MPGQNANKSLVLRPKPACRSGTAGTDQIVRNRSANPPSSDYPIEIGIPSLVPHFSHPDRYVDPALRLRLRRRMVTTVAMSTALEEVENAVRNKAAAQRQNMIVGISMLLSTEESRWLHQM